MPYFIETYDDARQAHIRQEKYQEHLNYLESIAPKLLACGAKLDDSGDTASGGVYLVDVDTRVEAKTLIQADPFINTDCSARLKLHAGARPILKAKNIFSQLLMV